MQAIDELLRFYFITDDGPARISSVDQVRVTLAAGATMVQYRNKQFGLHFYEEVCTIRELCHSRNVPLIINDNVLLAKAVDADGVHLGQDDDPPSLARRVLGPKAIVGLTVSSPEELVHGQLQGCDYIGTGPVFSTQTKKNPKPVRHLEGLKAMVDDAPLPVVAIGGITPRNAGACFEQGASGVAVISAVTRAPEPQAAARQLANACGIHSPSD